MLVLPPVVVELVVQWPPVKLLLEQLLLLAFNVLRGDRSIELAADETNAEAMDDSCADRDFSIAASGSSGLQPISLFNMELLPEPGAGVDKREEKSLSKELAEAIELIELLLPLEDEDEEEEEMGSVLI